MFDRKPGEKRPERQMTITTPIVRSPQAPTTRPAAERSEATAPSVIGAGLTVTGNLDSKGVIHVEGEIQGDIRAESIVVGESARVQGNLVAKEIVVRGSVGGSIRGNNVTVLTGSRVEGDIFHKVLAMEKGAFFEGRVRRSEDPLSSQGGDKDARSAELPATGAD